MLDTSNTKSTCDRSDRSMSKARWPKSSKTDNNINTFVLYEYINVPVQDVFTKFYYSCIKICLFGFGPIVAFTPFRIVLHNSIYSHTYSYVYRYTLIYIYIICVQWLVRILGRQFNRHTQSSAKLSERIKIYFYSLYTMVVLTHIKTRQVYFYV